MDRPLQSSQSPIYIEGTKILVIGDPHFKVSNVRETDLMVIAILRQAKSLLPDIIVVLGDVLDRHESIHVTPLTKSVIFLMKLSEIAPTYVLIGNHDMKNNRQFLPEEHPFVALKYVNNNRIFICDTTQSVFIKNERYVFVPYVPPGRFLEALNKVDGWQTAKCIFAHQEFRGAQMGAIVSTEGDEWSLDNPFVISGHIHDYQELKLNILYVGTPIQHTYSDSQIKTISLFVFGDTRSQERIPLGLPRKQIIRMCCANVSTYTIPENSELKIIISGLSAEIKAVMKHPNIEIWRKQGHKITYKDIPIERNNERNLVRDSTEVNYPRFSTLMNDYVSGDIEMRTIYQESMGFNNSIF